MDYTSDFDIDLKFGELFEQELKDIFTGKGKIEVKSERDKWKETGNIAIEIKQDDNISGLSITKADWWMHNLTINGNIVMSFMIPVDRLKNIVKQAVIDKKAVVCKGGDNNRFTLVLLPIRYLANIIFNEGE